MSAQESDSKQSGGSISAAASANDSQAQKIVKQIMFSAVERMVSDIFIEPQEDELRVRFRLDGLLQKVYEYPPEVGPGLSNSIKVLSGLDISERRFPQDGRFRMKISDKIVDFRVSVLPASFGENIVLRVLDKSGRTIGLENIDLEDSEVELLKNNFEKPYGLILVCGPTGSGKTTTLYAGLKHIHQPDVNIITVEDPVEYQIEGINQCAVRDSVGMTFAEALRSILRQDPDIVMIGEIRDGETADIAVKASLTGHLVLSTIHTNTATGSIIRLVNMGIEPFLVASSCLMAVSQKLARKLCDKCKKKADPPPGLLEQFKMHNIVPPEDFVYYTHGSCKACSNSGFKGRVAILEILELDADLRAMLIAGENEFEIRKCAISKGMRTLRSQALRKVIKGSTTYEEVLRVTTDA